ncbi:MAG TPA: glycoside hydrolase family 3 C-terminal domain-containing protein [Polyangiaceae bacterium]
MATSTESSGGGGFRDPDLPAETRLDDLVARLTLDEKLICLGTDPSVPRLGIRASGHVEGLHGLALGGPGRWGEDRPVPTTTFPQAIGLAETWDPEVVRRVAEVESHEARFVFQNARYRRGGLVVRAPNADLGRDPRWGRTEECYGEDAYFNGVMASAFVRGLQGDHPRYWRAASLLKHFLANSHEDGRERTSSDFDEALFREYYAWPFFAAITRGGARAFMAAYNAHDGVPCTTHPMLARVTVDEWGQDGILCTDGGAFRMLVTEHQAYPDLYTAAAACIRAGITQFLDDYCEPVEGALSRGLLREEDVDGAIRKNFRVMLRLGLLDPPERVAYARIGEDDAEPWASEEHRTAVLEATRASVVLLKNEGALLPLQLDATRSIAVLGPLADRVHVDWYSGTPPYAVTPLEGIRRKVGARATIRAVTNNDESDAVLAARASDVCVVCIGNHPTADAGWAQTTRPSYGKEAVDRRSLTLEDEALVKRVWEANRRTIVVLVSSFPYAILWTQENVPAIVHLTHNSQELGSALADVLFGDFNPAGRLVQTWPRRIEDLPEMLDYDIRRGRTYMHFEGEPLYPFGHGKSYTTFEYARLRSSADVLDEHAPTTLSVDVRNGGARAGDEVVQLYVRRPGAGPLAPRLALRGFRRVRIAPGETATVAFTLSASDFARWDLERGRFVVDSGEVEACVGASSADIRFVRTLEIPDRP